MWLLVIMIPEKHCISVQLVGIVCEVGYADLQSNRTQPAFF